MRSPSRSATLLKRAPHFGWRLGRPTDGHETLAHLRRGSLNTQVGDLDQTAPNGRPYLAVGLLIGLAVYPSLRLCVVRRRRKRRQEEAADGWTERAAAAAARASGLSRGGAERGYDMQLNDAALGGAPFVEVEMRVV